METIRESNGNIWGIYEESMGMIFVLWESKETKGEGNTLKSTVGPHFFKIRLVDTRFNHFFV